MCVGAQGFCEQEDFVIADNQTPTAQLRIENTPITSLHPKPFDYPAESLQKGKVVLNSDIRPGSWKAIREL